MALLLYTCWRFRESKNPTPSKTTHHSGLEIARTAIPVVILVAICIPSMNLLYFADSTDDADMTLKVIGHQWYWEYQYPDHGNFTFDANLIPEDELKPGQKGKWTQIILWFCQRVNEFDFCLRPLMLFTTGRWLPSA